jgi:hypothetical protein
MQTMIVILFLTLPITAMPQFLQVNGQPLSYYIANTAVFEENQTAPHVPIAPFDNREDAKAGDWTSSSWVQSLNGNWKFQWHAVT